MPYLLVPFSEQLVAPIEVQFTLLRPPFFMYEGLAVTVTWIKLFSIFSQLGGVPVYPGGQISGGSQLGGVPVNPAGQGIGTQLGGVPVNPSPQGSGGIQSG